MVLHVIIAVILGVIAAYVAGLFLPRVIADLIGVVVALAYFFGDPRRT